MALKEIKVKLTLIEGMLGTCPADEDVYGSFIGKNAPNAATLEEEIEALGVEEVTQKGRTIFPRTEGGRPFIYDYQIKGFFKDACSMLSRLTETEIDENGKKKKTVKNESGKITAFKKVIDGMIFVFPREIPIYFSGSMRDCQRPLRAQTAQGERVTLASSDEVPAGATMTFRIGCLDPKHFAAVIEWLDYGELRGLGQWRNSGKGRFTWEKIE